MQRRIKEHKGKRPHTNILWVVMGYVLGIFWFSFSPTVQICSNMVLLLLW